MQFVSGHGDFNFKLCSFSLVDNELCGCGGTEDARHVFCECPLYEEKRGGMRRLCEDRSIAWPMLMLDFARDNVLWEQFTHTCKDILEFQKSLRL